LKDIRFDVQYLHGGETVVV